MKINKSFNWQRAGSYSFLAYGAQLGLGFLAFLLIIRQLSTEAFGLWVLYVTLTTFAEMARTGLIQNGVIKFHQESAVRGEVRTAGLVLSLLSAVILAMLVIVPAFFLGAWWGVPQLFFLSWWYLPFAMLQAPTRFMESVWMAESDFRPVFWSKFAYGMVFLSMLLLIWGGARPLSVEWLPYLQLPGALLALLVNIIYRPSSMRLGPMNWAILRRLFGFGRYVMGTNMGSMLFNKMDILILGSFLGPAAVGLYNAAARITNFVEVPLTGAAQVIYPRIAAGHSRAEAEGISRLYEQGIAWLLALVLPLCLLVLAFTRPMILLLAGEEYLDAVSVLQILTLAILIKPWGRLFGITLDAIGRPELNFRLLGVSLIFNLILNLLLVPRWGIQGVALATLLTMSGNALVGQLMIRRFIPVNHWSALRQTFTIYRNILQLKLTVR